MGHAMSIATFQAGTFSYEHSRMLRAVRGLACLKAAIRCHRVTPFGKYSRISVTAGFVGSLEVRFGGIQITRPLRAHP